MGIFMIHILKSSVCLALFYLCYRMLLSKETFHRFNRIALLVFMLLSFLLPFIEVTMQQMPEQTQPFLLLEKAMETIEVKRLDVLAETQKHFPWSAFVFLVYASGILFFLLRHVWSVGRMLCLLRTCRKEKREDGITLYIHRAKVAPFSWMKKIAISEDDLTKHGETILAHERAHIRNHHSWDLLLAQACVFLQWFNPAAWLLKKELQIIHEYEADEDVICNGMNASIYLLSIIERSVGSRLFTIANNFNHNLLTQRITMMNKKKSNQWARLKYLCVLPLSALVVVAFAKAPVDKSDNQAKQSDIKITTKKENEKSASVMNWLKKNSTESTSGPSTNNPLVVIDGEVKGYASEILKKIDIDNIESMSVIKDQETISKLYGDKAKDGVIIIETKKKPIIEKLIFQVVEEMPEFPGGMEECMKFIKQNTQYPIEAHRKGIHGKVLVSGVISDKGDIESPYIYRSVDPLLDAEALRVVKSLPKWKPGKQRGKEVNVMFMLPVEF